MGWQGSASSNLNRRPLLGGGFFDFIGGSNQGYRGSMSQNRIVENHADASAMAEAASAYLLRAATEAVAQRGRFMLVLGGGSSPKQVYQLLAGARGAGFPWHQTSFLFGDERMVPADHPESNFKMASTLMLVPRGIDSRRVYGYQTNLPGADAARAYEETLRGMFDAVTADVVLLGMGADGHTLSLFPGGESAAWEDEACWCIAATAPAGFAVASRITTTLSFIHAARNRLFLVPLAGKEGAFARVCGGELLPAGRVKDSRWMVCP